MLLVSWQVNADAKNDKTFVLVSTNILGVIENNGGSEKGLAIEVLNKAAQKFNFSYRLEFYPWKRALKLTSTGQVDGIVGVYFSEARAKAMLYGDQSLYTDQQVMISLSSNNLLWSGKHEQLHGRSVALLLGGDYGPLFDSKKVDIVEVGTSQQQFSMLAKGRIDFIPNNPRMSSGLIAHLGLKRKLTFHKPALSVKRGYFAASKQSPFKDMLPKLDKVISEMKKTGEYKKLTDKHIHQLLI